MRILFISDTHFGYDFELAYYTVKKIIDKTSPELILSAGDWDFDKELISRYGTDWFNKLFTNHNVYSILGNHDLESGDDEAEKLIMGLKNSDDSRVFFDGLIEVNGLKILGVPGIIEDSSDLDYIKKTLIKHGDSEPDFLIMHDCPEFYPINLTSFIIKIVQPKNILCGHIHDEPFRIKQYDYYLESSDALCSDYFKKIRVNIIKVITTPPFTGYALIDYNIESRSINSLTLGRVV